MPNVEQRTNTIYKKTKLVINISATILALFFTWLQFDISFFKPLMTNELANFIFKIALLIYYFSWIFGTIADLKDEDYTFSIYPNQNKLTTKPVLIIITLAFLFAFLCYSNTSKIFVIALSSLFIFNVLSWLYIVNFAKPTFDDNKKKCIDKFEFEYHKVLENYLMGKWQWYRFIYAAFILILLNILIFSDLHLLIAYKLNCSPQFIISISLLFYVITFEIWVWVKRIERIVSFRIFDKLDNTYILKLK